jgi:hypothetical protein
MRFLNLCLSIPNLDTIIFYIIFVIIIPGTLFSSSDYDSLKYYLPALVMAAVTLTEAGKPDLFTNLYPTDCSVTTFSGFLSTNIINGIAIVGILMQSLMIAMSTSSISLGLISGLIIFAITFPLAQQILPYFIREVDDFTINEIQARGIYFPGNWHKYFAGLFFSIVLLGLQYTMLVGFTKYILSSNTKLI